MAIYEVVMVNNLGASSQFIEADTKPTIKEMNYYFDRFMVDNRLNRVSDVIEVTKSQFDKWNKRGDYKLHKYTSKKSSVSQQTNTKNIIQAKCIQKFRDKQGKIYGYRLIDLNGQTQDVASDNLKKAIANNQIHVINLTLSKDGRLMDTSEKQLQSKELGKAPSLNKNKVINNTVSLEMGYNIGHEYFRYLDSKLFGTISNNVFTVGHKIKTSDVREHKEYKGYSYVFHKDINKCGAPEISIAAFFKNASDSDVQVDIKIERHGYTTESMCCVGIRGYILDVESFILNNNTPIEKCARIVADKFNKLAPKLYDLADIHQSLYSNLKYNETLEKVSLEHLDYHGNIGGSELVDLAISRWTKIRGHRLPAKVSKIIYNNNKSFKILYANNVSDNGKDRRLYIEYDGNKITVKVVNGGNLNDVVIEESAEMAGSIVDNSPLLSEVLTKALISANVNRI